jgi:hypothetical protein
MNFPQVQVLVSKFERGTLSQDEWHHEEHIAIAFWYLKKLSYLDAVLRIKQGIMAFNIRYKISQIPSRGYHETITMFFVSKVSETIKNLPEGLSFEEELNIVLEKCTPFDILWSNYSKDVINHPDSRTRWVQADL